MIKITLNDMRLQRQLSEIARVLERPRQLYGVLGESLIKIHAQRFKDETDPQGNKWRPLSGEYAARKRKKGRGEKILRFDGNLANRLAYNYDDTGLEFGSPMVYAAVHQFGGKTGRGHSAVIPARPWLGLSDSDARLLERKAADHLQKMVKNIAG